VPTGLAWPTRPFQLPKWNRAEQVLEADKCDNFLIASRFIKDIRLSSRVSTDPTIGSFAMIDRAYAHRLPYDRTSRPCRQCRGVRFFIRLSYFRTYYSCASFFYKKEKNGFRPRGIRRSNVFAHCEQPAQ